MKNQLSKKTIGLSTLSFAVLFLFIYLGLGSTSLFGLLGVPIITTTDFNEQTKEYNLHIVGYKGEDGDTLWHQDVSTQKDYYGNWHGETQILNANISQKVESDILVQHTQKSTETVHFENGKRHGVSITNFVSFNRYRDDDELYDIVRSSDTTCYDYGHVIPCNGLKNATITSENTTGFQILNNYYPWFLGTLNVLGFTNEYVQTYMDSLEVLLNAESFDFTKFDSNYDDVIELLEETAYDSLVQINKMVTSVYGIELMKDLDFRMAVIDQQRDKNKTIFQLLQSSYPHFLTSFNSEEVVVKDSEWDAFCSKFDSLMNKFPPLDISDPFFTDSVDTRIFGVLNAIYEEEPDTTKSATIQSALKQAVSNKRNLCLPCLLKEHDKPLLRQHTSDIAPQNFAFAIMIRMYRIFLYDGDIPRLAIKEAYTNQQNIATLASVTTQLNGEISENKFELLGNVVKGGGAEITERGLVWAKYNNPTIDDNKIIAGEGIGAFTSSLQITDDSTYYIRAFATNSVGAAYGNTIILSSSGLVGLDEIKSRNLKFKIYPNPASDEISLEFHLNKSQKMALELIDLNGKIVLHKQMQNVHIGKNNIRIDISGVSNGVYIAKLSGIGNFQYSKKLQISH